MKKNQNREYPCLLFTSGSLTVEAAFCATIFFLALFSLLYLFSMLLWINQTQMRLASAVWQYECFSTKLGSAEAFLKQSVLIRWDEEQNICYVKEIQGIPFLGGRFFRIPMYQQMQINHYTGRSMVSEGKDSEEYVYLAETGTVYHRDKGCVYLNPDIQSMRYHRVDAQRNRSGAKYKACKSCCKGIGITSGGIVYLTPYGDRFHISRTCSGLKRTVRKVPLSGIGSMPPCSKCAQ